MRKLVTVAIAVALASSVGVGVAVATARNGDVTIRTEGVETFEANVLIQATLRFSPERVEVPTGGTIKFIRKDQAPDEPHTLSIVNQSQLPRDVEEVFNCKVCNKILASHFPGGKPVLRVDRDGDGGMNVPGDSLLLLPGVDDSITAVVTAPPGTLLHYLCAIHPWMQAFIKVTS